MDFILDTSSTEFQACGPFEPRYDKDGVHRRYKSGGTNLPLYAGKPSVSHPVQGNNGSLVARDHGPTDERQ